METINNQGDEVIIARGKIFELVQAEQLDGRVFEVARRAPGVRTIIHDEAQGKVLLTREFRAELDAWDYRLPGGKVFDTLAEFENFRNTGQDIVQPALGKARAESLEEAGIVVDNLIHIATSTLGATVEWDLFVFESNQWYESSGGQQLEEGEEIEANSWLSYEEAEGLILAGGMHEERIALILLRWIKNLREDVS